MYTISEDIKHGEDEETFSSDSGIGDDVIDEFGDDSLIDEDENSLHLGDEEENDDLYDFFGDEDDRDSMY